MIGHARGAVLQVGVWIVVAAIIILIALPTVRAVLRRRKERQAQVDLAPAAMKAAAIVPEVPIDVHADADTLLARAEAMRARGELRDALYLYLAASLRALHLRGAIEYERHKTNGEYVRGCNEDGARAPLREIVRAVDRVQFGGEAATSDVVANVALRAGSLVRVAATMALMALAMFGVGCDASSKAAHRVLGDTNDPGGTTLVHEALKAAGADVAFLSTSMRGLDPKAPHDFAIVLDAGKLAVDEEGWGRLVAWVEAGGALAVAGGAHQWPKEFHASTTTPEEARVRVMEELDGDGDKDHPPTRRGRKSATAQLLRAAGLSFPEDEDRVTTVATAPGGIPYAAVRHVGDGRVLLLATDDLLSNAGVARPESAAALVMILQRLHTPTLRFMRLENLISPASNPLSALARAGLTLPLLHALAAMAIL